MKEEGIFWKPLSGQIAQRLEACSTPKGSSRTSFWSRLSDEHLMGKAGGHREGQLGKRPEATRDFYWMFIIRGAWEEVGGVFPLPLTYPLATRSSVTGHRYFQLGMALCCHGWLYNHRNCPLFLHSFGVVGFPTFLSMK